MAVTEGIIVPITADAKGLEAGMASAKKAVENFGSTGTTSIVSFDKSINDLNKRLLDLKAALSIATNPTDIKRLSLGIAGTTKEIEIQQNAYKKLAGEGSEAFNKIGRGANDAYSFVRKLAYALPGVGIGTIFLAAFEAAKFLVTGISEVTKEQKKLNDETVRFQESAAKEIIKFKELSIIAADNKLSMSERKEAIKELRSAYGPYLKNLSDEKILAGELGTAYDKITDALRAKIALQVLEEKIVPIIKEQLALQLKQDDLQKTVTSGVNSAALAKIMANERLTDADKKYFNTSSLLARNAGQEMAKNQPILDQLTKKIQSAFSAMKPFIEASSGLTVGDIKPGKGEIIKKEHITEVDKILTHLANTLAGIHNQLSVGFINGNEFKTDQIKAYNHALEELSRLGYEGVSTFDKLAKKLYDVKRAFTVGTLTAPDQIDGATGGHKEIEKAIEDARQTQRNKNAIAAMKEQIALTKEWANAFKSILGPAINRVFVDLMEGGHNAIASLISDLGKLIVRLIAAVAEAAILAALMMASGLGVASGDTFTSLFKGFLGFKVPGHAAGGITNGPHLAMVGEGKEREVITPLSQLKNIIGNSKGGGAMPIPQLFMKGNDFWLMYQRSQRQNQRNL